jgi:two-component system chemotaxis response regulator CheB
VVDDSALYRQMIQNVLREIPDTSIVGTAKDGVDALEKIEQLNPDLLTLDVQMPDMDGIQVLHEIRRRGLRPGAIMVSSYTSEGAQVTTDALLEGAFDFILKPSSHDSSANRQQLLDALASKITAFRDSSRRLAAASSTPTTTRQTETGEVTEVAPAPQAACRAVILGSSTGGPAALKTVLARLPAGMPVPLFIVQHMPAQYTRSLAARLDEISELAVVEAADGMEAVAGTALVAPGGKQMKLESTDTRLLVRVNSDAPEHGVRPSVDYLIRSAVRAFDGNALAVIMTGMGQDGLAGCMQLKQAGGYVFAQCQDGCVVFGMPKVVIEKGLADRVLPLGKIAPAIVRHIKRSRRS